MLNLFLQVIEITIQKDTVIYFNSAIAQSSAALLTIVGMFSVFRMQAQDALISRTYDSIKEYFFSDGNNSKRWLDKDLKFYLRQKKTLSSNEVNRGSRDYRIQLYNQEDFKVYVKKKIGAPIKQMATMFIISVTCLPWSHFLTSASYKILGLLYMYCMTIFIYDTIRKTIEYVFLSFTEPKEVIYNLPDNLKRPPEMNIDDSDYQNILDYVDFIEFEISFDNIRTENLYINKHQSSLEDAVNRRKARYAKLKEFYQKDYFEIEKNNYFLKEKNIDQDSVGQVKAAIGEENNDRAIVLKSVEEKFNFVSKSEILKVFYKYWLDEFTKLNKTNTVNKPLI